MSVFCREGIWLGACRGNFHPFLGNSGAVEGLGDLEGLVPALRTVLQICACLTALGGTPCLRALPQGLCWSWGHPRAPFQGVVVGRLMGEMVPGTWLLQTLKGSFHL